MMFEDVFFIAHHFGLCWIGSHIDHNKWFRFQIPLKLLSFYQLFYTSSMHVDWDKRNITLESLLIYRSLLYKSYSILTLDIWLVYIWVTSQEGASNEVCNLKKFPCLKIELHKSLILNPLKTTSHKFKSTSRLGSWVSNWEVDFFINTWGGRR